MEFHFCLLAAVLVLFFLSVDKNKHDELTFLAGLLFFLLAFLLIAFRNETVGNDTIKYVNYFQRFSWADDPWDFIIKYRYEPGYTLLNFAISKLSDNYTSLLSVCAAINMICTIYFYRATCTNKYSWCLLWFITGAYYWNMSAIRASLAISFICIFAVNVLREQKIRSLFWLFLAGMFHYSSLVCGIMLLLHSKLLERVMRNKFILTISFIAIALFLNQIMTYIPDVYSHYYFDSEYAEGSVRIASIIDFIFSLLFYLLLTWKVTIYWKNQLEVQFLFLLLVGISFLGLIFNPFNRIERFFLPFEIICLVNTYKYLPRFRKIGVIVLVVGLAIYQVVTFIVRPEWLQLFPYSFA